MSECSEDIGKILQDQLEKMCEMIIPPQNRDIIDEEVTCEHIGYFEPEIRDDTTYNELVNAIKESGSWLYSGPNRIEPVQEGYIDIQQLQEILNKFEYQSRDFFRGSISLWGKYKYDPSYLEIIYVKKIDNRMVLITNVLKAKEEK